jgi:hypothetical protein
VTPGNRGDLTLLDAPPRISSDKSCRQVGLQAAQVTVVHIDIMATHTRTTQAVPGGSRS